MKLAFGNRDAWLKLLALVLIGLAAGPEVGLAMEMTTLLEILGAAIFFLSFSVGAKLLFMDLAASLRAFLHPPVVSAMSRPRAIVYTAVRICWFVVTVFIAGRWCLEMSRGLWI